MKGLWAGISGIIEGDEDPLYRAKKEINEETRISENQISLLKSVPHMRAESPQYANHEWIIYPFLFAVREPTIRLNWENSDYRWVYPEEILKFETVPSLDKVLSSLL